ncbi:flagellar export protein FliJ [Halomonas sp. McH1-25]|uniref:flagellar export protein FliJ n=1 Tax=unclassified Halomonas TaxID=2609666 RepID=UPI001EF439C6|nr:MULTISPECIES: flagellar export protein FliJ [unclassified Halomonas]MCG7598647.1 flagellar export protein FliJ [Halomonas sp. McH1-25]MCP1343630.1 flagellar export protein FliJ [Halomonas sp. FL8]MCP1359381.1 flagellar export protein FliJ [Halomonas sp. BBD45]MCP1366674.1 flagellar export protein FliJ [Halomonas sp. BBD48]
MVQATTPLDTLISLTRDTRDNASIELGNLRRDLQSANAQLETLTRYRFEYRQRLQQAMESGIGPDSWRNYQQFLASLDAAIARARQTLGEREARLNQGQKRWQNEQRKLSAYDTLATRRETAVQQRANRQEQRLADEMAAGLVLRRQRQETNSEPSH